MNSYCGMKNAELQGIMEKLFLPLLVVAALSLTACGSSSGSNPEEAKDNLNQFSVNSPVYANDLAFLFPIVNGRPQPFVTLSSQPDIPGRGNFNEVLNAARADGVFFNDNDPNDALANPTNWAMVSFRYTSCELFVGTENPCKEQMRFVYQPMSPTAGEGFLDFSLHVTYEFAARDASAASEVMAAVYKLRESAAGLTDQKALTVHPVLSDASNRNNYFKQIRDTLWKPFIFDSNPKAITFMGLGRNAANPTQVNLGEWHFLFGLIDNSGTWRHQQLPDGSGEMTEIVSVDQVQGSPTFGNLSSNISDGQFNILTSGRVDEFAAAGALSPHASNEHNVNCGSCHVVDNQVLRPFTNGGPTPARLDTRGFNFDQFAFELADMAGDDTGFKNGLVSNRFKGGMFASPAVPTVNGVAPQDEVVTRMFGYMHAQPVINQRMAFDNGMAVNEFNKVIRMSAREQELSFANCTDIDQKIAVMTCMFSGNRNTSLDQCLSQSCR